MPNTLTPERKALLDELVKDGWPLIEMHRTHRFSWDTVRRHHPDYRGMDQTEAAKLGNTARQVTLAIRRRRPTRRGTLTLATLK
jgi:hypothetical protein